MQILRAQGLPHETTNMTSFFWNVRGFNKSLKHSIVQEWVRSSNMSFGCILETRVKESKSEGVLKKVFKDWSYVTNYEHGQGGRIWLVWKEEVRMIPVYKTDQLITVSVKLLNQEEFFYTCIYANNLAEDRRELWEDLCHHNDSSLFQNKA